jgi:hypothetical protein
VGAGSVDKHSGYPEVKHVLENPEPDAELLKVDVEYPQFPTPPPL